MVPENSNNEDGDVREIVYVDDVAQLVTIGCRILADAGYTPNGFTDPSEALDYIVANADSIALIMADRSMPGMSGIVLHEAVMALPSPPPFVLVTSLHDESQTQAYRDLGMEDVLAKPYSRDELASMVERTIRIIQL